MSAGPHVAGHRTTIRQISIPGSLGSPLAATLELPDGAPTGVALFAHCFTCSSQSHAATRISAALADRGFAVLRFDFTGLGTSEGDFADTSFTTNIEDLLLAAGWLRANVAEPTLLVGHSLGGAAVIAAAGSLPSVRAVVTIGAPSCPDHVLHLFSRIEDDGADRVRVDIGGRPFEVGRAFLEDIALQPQLERLGALHRALLVMHSPTDEIVGVDNARAIYDAARHPKSFVALDGADHLLSRREDSQFAADVIAAWAPRHLRRPETAAPAAALRAHALPESVVLADAGAARTGRVVVSEAAPPGYAQSVTDGIHTWALDEPLAVGGTDTGPNPYDVLLSALGACTAITMRMYAGRKGWDLGATSVSLRHSRIHAKDCVDCENAVGMVDHVERRISLDPALTPAQRSALLAIADKCPVHRTLTGSVHVSTSLAAR